MPGTACTLDNDVHTLGFSVEQISELVALWRDRDRASTDVKRIALEHVDILERKARELHEMAATLRHLAKHCHGDERPERPIIEGLANNIGILPSEPHSPPQFGVANLQQPRQRAARRQAIKA